MANIGRDAVKLMAEEIVRAMKSINDKNNSTYVNNQIKNFRIGTNNLSPEVYRQIAALPASTVTPEMIAQIEAAAANAAQSAELSSSQIQDLDASITSIVVNEIGSVELRTDQILGLDGAISAVLQNATIQTAQIDELYGSYAEFIHLVAENAEFENVNAETLRADFARLGLAEIDSATIDWAQIGGLVAGTALIREGVGGKLYIDTLAVTEANMVSLTVGELIVKGDDGKFYAIVVDEHGDISTEEKRVTGDNIENSTIGGGNLIENTITARELNVSSIFADNALIGAIKAANIDVNDLFAHNAFINLLNTSVIQGLDGNALDISSNKAIILRATNEYVNAEIATSEVSGAGYRLALVFSESPHVTKQGAETILSAHIYLNDDDVTSAYDASWFMWVRKSDNAAGDTAWNTNNAHSGVKSVTLTMADADANALIECIFFPDEDAYPNSASVYNGDVVLDIDDTDYIGSAFTLDADGNMISSAAGVYAINGDGELIYRMPPVLSAQADITAGFKTSYITIRNDKVDIVSGGSLNMKSSSDINMESASNLNVKSGADINVQSGGNIVVGANGNIGVQSGGHILVVGTGDIGLASGGKLVVGAESNVQILSGGAIDVNANGSIDIDSGAHMNINVGGEFSVKSGANMSIDAGGEFDLAAGSAQGEYLGIHNKQATNTPYAFFAGADGNKGENAPFAVNHNGEAWVRDAHVSGQLDVTHALSGGADVAFGEDVTFAISESAADNLLLSISRDRLRTFLRTFIGSGAPGTGVSSPAYGDRYLRVVGSQGYTAYSCSPSLTGYIQTVIQRQKRVYKRITYTFSSGNYGNQPSNTSSDTGYYNIGTATVTEPTTNTTASCYISSSTTTTPTSSTSTEDVNIYSSGWYGVETTATQTFYRNKTYEKQYVVTAVIPYSGSSGVLDASRYVSGAVVSFGKSISTTRKYNLYATTSADGLSERVFVCSVSAGSSISFNISKHIATIVGKRLVIERADDAADSSCTLSGGSMYVNYTASTPVHAEYVYDGTSWLALNEVEEDTGWSYLTPTNGTTSSASLGNGLLRIRKVGAHVFVAGGVEIDYTGTQIEIASLPYAPIYCTQYFLRACTGARVARLNVQDTGKLELEWVRNLSDGEMHSGSIWVDCNLDFFVDA